MSADAEKMRAYHERRLFPHVFKSLHNLTCVQIQYREQKKLYCNTD